MARPRLPAADVVDGASPERVAAGGRALAEVAALDNEAALRTHDLALKLGYEGPLEPDLLERGVVYSMRRTVEASLETGRMLLLLKERVEHGDFLSRVDRIGLDRRLAQRFMQAAVKFAKAASKPHLLAAIGNQTKLLELLVLDEGEIQQLAEEGAVGDIELDAIESMSVSELRAALRERQQTIQAKDKLLNKRDQRITSLEEELERPFKLTEGSVAKSAEEKAAYELLAMLSASFYATAVDLIPLVDDILEGNFSDTLQLRARQEAISCFRLVTELLLEHNIPVTPDEIPEAPAFVQQLEEALIAKGLPTMKERVAQRIAEREARGAARKKASKR